MTGVGSFVADALHRPDAMPSLKFFLQPVSMKGQIRLRTASPNSFAAGAYPKSSVILRGTGGNSGCEMGFHRFRYRFRQKDWNGITHLFKLRSFVSKKLVTVGETLNAGCLSNGECPLLLWVKTAPQCGSHFVNIVQANESHSRRP